ncbi:TolC family protein [Pseudolabrys sp.]|jgi:cobalt-zinc-cadmium efflux system outer membrane protein|uniref:TolC family protein n=1 Tax=Pseudolabrys sp. TaxID=1960880 RepID=UPI003D0D87D8
MCFQRTALLALALLAAGPITTCFAADKLTGLTLERALHRAVTSNPKLAAADRDIGIAAGKHIQAGAIPNPELSFELDNAFGTESFRGFDSAEKTIGIGQLIELGGKRGARIAAGAAELQSARWQREATRLEILSDTAVAFFDVLGAQRKVQIFDEQITALDRLAPLLQRRIDAGASSPGEIARVQVASDLVRAERERARTALAIARRELAVLMGSSRVDFSYVSGNLSQVGRLPAFSALLRQIDGNPQLARWTAVRAQKDAELLSARLKSVPDLKLELAWKLIREPGEPGAGSRNNQAFRVGASIPIPVWDQNLGNVAAAREERAKVEAERDGSRAALILTLAKAYDSQAGALREIEVLRGSALPNARRALDTIESGYSQGRFALLDVLDSLGTAAQVAQREQEALVIFHTSVATIQGLTGISLGITRVRGQ